MKKTYLLALLLCLAAFSSSMSYASVESDLINDIKKSQKTLNKTQADITRQSQKLHKETSKAEQAVLVLRKETSAARRLMDEQTLSLNKLEKRLNGWQQQDTYQRNLLARFSQQQKMSESTDDVLSQAHLTALTDHFSQLRSALNPQWKAAPVIIKDGSLQQNQILTMGPVAWFLDENNQQAGFLIKEDTQFKQGLLLGSSQFEQLSLLMNTEQASNQPAQISFDPTLTRALKIVQSQESVIDHVEKGGIWVLPIIAFGVFALIISLCKGFQLTRLPAVLPAMAERLSHINTADQTQVNQLTAQAKGMQRELINISLASPAGQRRDDQLFSALLMQKHTLEYWLGAVAITAAVSPLLGLLGTVSGMIETFKLMTLFGAGDASAVSGGISEALVTTELGLVVAIPALLMHALLSRKVKTYYGALESCAVQLSQTSTTPLAEAA